MIKLRRFNVAVIKSNYEKIWENVCSKAEMFKNFAIHELIIQGKVGIFLKFMGFCVTVYIEKEKLISVNNDDFTVFLFHVTLFLKSKNSTSGI